MNQHIRLASVLVGPLKLAIDSIHCFVITLVSWSRTCKFVLKHLQCGNFVYSKEPPERQVPGSSPAADLVGAKKVIPFGASPMRVRFNYSVKSIVMER